MGLCALAVAAQNIDIGLRFEKEGLAYAVYDYANPGRVVSVIMRDGGYSGDVVIPAYVIHDGVVYTVAAIDADAFRDTAITSVTVPSTIRYIGENAFLDCAWLSAVNISDLGAWCKTEFHSNPLFHAGNLYLNGELVEQLRIPGDITSVPDLAFYGASCIKGIDFPASLTAIGKSAFSQCTGLEKLVVPAPVAIIDNSAFFHNTSLSHVWLPSTLTALGSLAFAECTSLTEMAAGMKSGTSVARGLQPFSLSPTQEGTLYVPEGSLPTYDEQIAWAEWGEIVEADKCDLPTIALNDSQLTFNCATADATITASVTSADFGTSTTEAPAYKTLTGQYTVTAQATAPQKLESDPAEAYVVWELTNNPLTGVDTPQAVAAGEPLLITRNGNSLTINGTESGDVITFYSINGTLLHRQKTEAGSTMITSLPAARQPIIINLNNRSYKLWL